MRALQRHPKPAHNNDQQTHQNHIGEAENTHPVTVNSVSLRVNKRAAPSAAADSQAGAAAPGPRGHAVPRRQSRRLPLSYVAKNVGALGTGACACSLRPWSDVGGRKSPRKRSGPRWPTPAFHDEVWAGAARVVPRRARGALPPLTRSRVGVLLHASVALLWTSSRPCKSEKSTF